MPEKSRDYVLVIHDIRSAHNVGALLRTADAVGITRVIFSGFSPRPIDRFGRPRPDIAKAALGAELTIPWESCDAIEGCIARLKADDYTIVGLEQDVRSVDYKGVAKTEKMVFILGTETTGLVDTLRNQCDVLAEIPMRGTKESLNVSVAAGIFLYRILDQE